MTAFFNFNKLPSPEAETTYCGPLKKSLHVATPAEPRRRTNFGPPPVQRSLSNVRVDKASKLAACR
jgi:hypothetical protein